MKELLIDSIKDLDSSKKANEFLCDLVVILEKAGAEIKKEVSVKNRGDGRKGRIDIVADFRSKVYAIEIDWKSPRKKSIFKIENYPCDERFIILREDKRVLSYGEIMQAQTYWMKNL